VPAPILRYSGPMTRSVPRAARPAANARHLWHGRLLVLLALLPLLGACSQVAFYWQAGLGQWEILAKRRSFAEVLADPAVPAPVKAKLRLVEDVQAYSLAHLALPRQGQYTTYTDLGRPYVTWLVVAAPALSLEAHRFCYLIVGCLGYRGYFAKADADAQAAELRGAGLDVIERGVRAYSTLGWFSDPVLNTFLARDDTELIRTVIHEQTHRRYFLKGDTDFNESFAEFVEQEGTRRYLSQPGRDPALLARYEAARADEERFLAIVRRGRERLVALYASAAPDAEKLARKPAGFEAMRQDYQSERASFKLENYDPWFARPLNNADLVGVEQYARHVAAFRALFRESDADFARFFAAVENLGALPAEERAARLNELEHRVVAQSRPQ
jgi:predicted aminopeptidase